MRQQIAAAENKDDSYWQAVGLMQAQLDGVYLGYNAAMDAAVAAGSAAEQHRLSRDSILFLNYNGECVCQYF